jgi:hypothetical protein
MEMTWYAFETKRYVTESSGTSYNCNDLASWPSIAKCAQRNITSNVLSHHQDLKRIHILHHLALIFTTHSDAMNTRFLTYLLTELSPSCEAANCAASQHFKEPEGSSPCSQEPSTGPYPEPDRSSPYHPILSKIDSNTVHPPTSWSS